MLLTTHICIPIGTCSCIVTIVDINFFGGTGLTIVKESVLAHVKTGSDNVRS